MPAEPKLTAEERVRAVTHDMFELLLVHNNDAIRIAEEHAAAAVKPWKARVAELERNLNEADARAQQFAETGVRIMRERDEAWARIADLERELSETYAIRSALDCVYAGPYMEPDAGTKSHCPPDKPCQRCLLERERDGLVKASAGFIRAWEQAERERDDARAEVDRLREVATELLKVADLRGDSELPHPADDPIDWTARMQEAWDDLRAALKAADGGEGL